MRKKMNEKTKGVWLEALRSGEYKQGKGALCKNGKFCCLGVLYDVAGKRWEQELGSISWSVAESESYETAYLPDSVAHKFGITYDTQRALAKMNDGIGYIGPTKNFRDIASWIEENL